jgi:hypothetical protein
VFLLAKQAYKYTHNMSTQPTEQSFTLADKALVSLVAVIPFSVTAAVLCAVIYSKSRKPVTGNVVHDVLLWTASLGLFYIASFVIMLPSWNIKA